MAIKTKKRKILQLKKKPKKLDLSDHIKELKNRFLFWFGCFLIASIGGYLLYQPLLDWILTPLNSPLFYTSPVGALQAVFVISILFGFIISLPILFYETIRFLEPAIEKKLNSIFIYIFISFLLAISGVLTAYYSVLPATLQFLSNFATGKLQALISTQDYFSFITKYFIAFAIFFQIPLIVYILGRVINLQVKVLLKYWRHVFVLSFLLSAIITPTPDLINQSIMAIPIIILYLISIIVLAISNNLSKIKLSK
jgi:sec-independent protein translocase protein TatC